MEINLDSCIDENCWFPAKVVDSDYVQQFSASDLGRHYSLLHNMEINLDSCFDENCFFFFFFFFFFFVPRGV